MAFRITLILVLALILISCSSDTPVAPNSNTEAAKLTEPSANRTENSNSSLTQSNSKLRVNDSDAKDEMDRRFAEMFQTCRNGYTYTVSRTVLGTVSDSVIYEIEGFDKDLQSTKDRPDDIERSNGTYWIGSINIKSTKVRDYDILKGCWSKYYANFPTRSFGLTYAAENQYGQPKWHLDGVEKYKRPSCSEVEEYINSKKICPSN